MLTALFVCGAHADLGERIAACGACHGADGNSAIAGVPSLAGQPRIFLENYMVLTREGIRGGEVMQRLLREVSDRDIAALARHYSALAVRPAKETVNEALFARGRELARSQRCDSCHMSDYRGRDHMPRLAGQREDFLAEVMLAYRQNRRPGGDTIMAASLYGIGEADLKALAHYFAHLQ